MVMVWILAHGNDSFLGFSTIIFRTISCDSLHFIFLYQQPKKLFYRYYDYYVVHLLKFLIGFIYTKIRQEGMSTLLSSKYRIYVATTLN